MKTSRILLFIVGLLVVSLACVTPVVPLSTPDANAINTMIAQTFAAAATQTARAFVPIPGLASPTFTPELPILSPTSTLSPTPVFTSTPEVTLISVSVATNCRVGPGAVYDRVGELLVGQVAEVVGVDPTGNYWYIRNPDSDPEFCWLWGKYADLVGSISALPVYTPAPTPTPNPAFEVSYASLGACTDQWWADLRLTNTGGVTFKSVSASVRDLTNDAALALTANGFKDKDACPGSTTADELKPGDKLIFSTPVFAYDISGHRLRATLTLCSEKDLGGLCATQVISFRP